MTNEIRWIKIVTDIFDDEKILLIESMPEADSIIVIWFKLLCLAGKQNNCGVFTVGRIAYTDEMFATIFRRNINTVRLALQTFERFGMIEVVNNCVTIPNWSKHQDLDKIEAKNAYMRDYMREYREKQKALTDGKANGKSNSKANVSDAEKKRKDIEKNREERENARARFERFWEAYPRKAAKARAQTEFARLDPDDATLDTILRALEEQKGSDQWVRDGGQYIPHPATWLHQRRWEDEAPQAAKAQAPRQVSAARYEQREYTEEDFDRMIPNVVLEALEKKEAACV